MGISVGVEKGVNFLSQVRLSHEGDGPKVAKRLIEVYFALFKVLISDANREHGTNKCSKEKARKISSSKCNPKNAPPESHVEMDSRKGKDCTLYLVYVCYEESTFLYIIFLN
ncbi:uncharacterized protein LOC113777890 [Coffea eugenioides]|uniref:uncharacterized protein LOC113777890 n=1 Tax=Coffea eugenioides TaxID=49369 RepID=UPI000F607714|nr:uncharacterized protein LOC113777890 [Coffea eugenioides]